LPTKRYQNEDFERFPGFWREYMALAALTLKSAVRLREFPLCSPGVEWVTSAQASASLGLHALYLIYPWWRTWWRL
jgi:hypothetical protein